MLRLTMMLYSLIGTTLAGTIMVAALTMGQVTAQALIGSAVLGFVLGLPVSWLVARAILNRET
ncbi:CTP synthetase [Stagnihabitans tardus]|uniref:CTP synthetase n=1 Tax=Stagnihabitans tardus TaxID=2699202 RepID=A0AAE4YAR4_9RHOB|nr:CTP synthetase [Stagnihabitans tardus]NBZ88217.1 CTP synthetase [Stagnihabitans tardus]